MVSGSGARRPSRRGVLILRRSCTIDVFSAAVREGGEPIGGSSPWGELRWRRAPVSQPSS